MRFPRLLLLPLTLLPAAVSAQGTPAPLARAFQLIQSGDFAPAVSLLDSLTAAEPDNARAWSLLGFARYQTRDLEGALAADLRATAFATTRPTALYNAGLMYALLGNRDSAFASLFRAKDTHRIDLTQIGGDSDAVSLRDDPRYARLFPSAAEFAHPFVEPASILREWRGDTAGDQFGWIARDAGDLDGDGIHDVVTSAPGGSGAGGKVYAFSTGTGRLLWRRAGAPGDALGTGVEAAGDVNHDGTPDVIAGAPGGGKAFVYSGRDGHTLLSFAAEDSTDAFGRHVADVGDVNGDGHADLLVGAPLNDAGGRDAGRLYLYSGRDGSLLHTWTGETAGDNFGASCAGAVRHGTVWIIAGAPLAGPRHTGVTYVYRGLNDRPAFEIPSDSTGFRLGGMFVSVVGDVDHDGTADIYASDWPNQALGRSTGRIYVYSGRTGRALFTLTGEDAGDGFGIGPADLGDINGDGYDDLVIGAWQFAGAAPSGGKIYIYSGKDHTLLRSITGRVSGETLGFDATGLGDVNGDGVPDLLVTSAWSAINGTKSGRVFVLSGD